MAHIHSSSSLYMSILSEIQLHESRSTSSPHLPNLQHFFFNHRYMQSSERHTQIVTDFFQMEGLRFLSDRVGRNKLSRTFQMKGPRFL